MGSITFVSNDTRTDSLSKYSTILSNVLFIHTDELILYRYDTKNGHFMPLPFLKKGKKGPKERFWALFLKRNPKRVTITNGFIPSGETYKWLI